MDITSFVIMAVAVVWFYLARKAKKPTTWAIWLLGVGMGLFVGAVWMLAVFS